MKRDLRLRGLSAEHHHALVLARTISERVANGSVDDALVRLLADRFARELEPHFQTEEQLLLPALRAIGEEALVARTQDDHACLRSHVCAASEHPTEHLAAFAELLVLHVRFEERELFPCCEAKLGAEVLDEVARTTDTRARREQGR